MKTTALTAFVALTMSAMPVIAAPQFFFGDPPDDTHPWAQHDHNRPQPPVIKPPAKPGDPPSDAVVLFDGSEESFNQNWQHVSKDRKADWVLKDGAIQSVKGAGYIETKQEFGDLQLHVEWAAPSKVEGTGQGRGNSGVFLPGKPEIQVLDNYDNPTYADGTAGALYGVMPPMVNALRPPGEWQTYDIIYRRPITKDGEVVDEGSVTVLLNGVVIQDSVPLDGGGGWRKRTSPVPYPEEGSLPEKGPLQFQDHGNPVRFRNVWVRELRKRPSEGGTDGRLSVEATMAKRAETAKMLFDQAQELEGEQKMYKLLESLVYQHREPVYDQAIGMTNDYVAKLKAAPEKLEARKKDVVSIFRALDYLHIHDLVPKPMPAHGELEKIMDEKEWKKGR